MNKPIKSKIGGQALIEGVMMRGLDKVSMAVRLESGDIDLEQWNVTDLKNKKWYCKIPIVRGVFNFIESMILGYKCLMKSAAKVEIEDDEEPSKFEQKIIGLFGDNLMKIVSGFAMVLGVVLAVVLFMWLPAFIVTLLSNTVELGYWKAVIEGVIKIALFIGYLAGVSCMKDIKRTFMYHGAEHKTIACYEAGDELTVENVKKHKRFHPRCGTSFLIIVLIISILVFSLVTWDNLWIRILIKIILLPVVVGIAYEFIKLAGKYDNPFTKIISAPGLALQRLTTNEPDDSQIEVAIAALTPVIPENREDDSWDL